MKKKIPFAHDEFGPCYALTMRDWLQIGGFVLLAFTFAAFVLSPLWWPEKVSWTFVIIVVVLVIVLDVVWDLRRRVKLW